MSIQLITTDHIYEITIYEYKDKKTINISENINIIDHMVEKDTTYAFHLINKNGDLVMSLYSHPANGDFISAKYAYYYELKKYSRENGKLIT